MKRKNQHLFTRTEAVKLFVDDLERIVSILSELPEESGITIATSEHELSIEELLDYDQKVIHELDIWCTPTSPSLTAINVSVNIDHATVYSNTDTAACRGIFSTIETLLRSHYRFWNRPTWPNRLSLVGGSSLIFVVLGQINQMPSLTYTGVALGGISLGSLALYYGLARARKSVIILGKREEQTSFWSQNKNAIWLLIIGAIVGTALSELVQYLFGLLPQP